MTPMMLPRSSSGTHMTDVSFRFTTDSEFLNASSLSASEMMSGLCVLTTCSMIESDSWRTASEMVSRRMLRATLTTGSPDSISTRKPLSALDTAIMTSSSWSSRVGSS